MLHKSIPVLLALAGAASLAFTLHAQVGQAGAQSKEKGSNRMIVVAVDVAFGEHALDVEGVRDAFRTMEEATRKEPGCLKYVSSVDVHDPRVVRIYEVWESMEALKPHFKTTHMAAFQEALSGLKTESMEARVFEVSRELPFPN